MNNQYDNLLEAIADLNNKGYSNSFNITNNGLYCPETRQSFQPGNVEIVGFHRFEGATDFEDMSIIYVLETRDGTKGILIDAFGTYSNTALGEFLRKTHFRYK